MGALQNPFIVYASAFGGSHPGPRRGVFATWYERYLRSHAWRIRRAYVLDRDCYRCVECGKRATQVHHRTYKRVGYERLADLVSVCSGCHAGIHGAAR